MLPHNDRSSVVILDPHLVVERHLSVRVAHKMQTSMNIRHGEIVRTSLAKEMKRDMWGAILIASHPAFNFEFSTMDRNVHDCFISQVSSSLEVFFCPTFAGRSDISPIFPNLRD